MGLLGKKNNKIEAVTDSEIPLGKQTNRSPTSPLKKQGANQAGGSPTKSVKKSKKSANERLVWKYMRAINSHASLEDLLSFYTSKKVSIEFEDGLKVSAQQDCELFQHLFKSFPDIKWDYKSLKELSETKVLVDETKASGHHTGLPYKFKNFPEIQAEGKRFENDPALFYFTLKEGKIDRIEIVALGSKTGPIGIYENLTGEVPVAIKK